MGKKSFVSTNLCSLLVWTELEKENKEFFEAYSKNREESVMEMMREMVTEMASRDPEDDEG